MNLKLDFGKDKELQIELVNSPVVEHWVSNFCNAENHFKSINKEFGYTVNKFSTFPPDGKGPFDDREKDKAVAIVEKINEGILLVDSSIIGSKFPYKAYFGMPFSQTNLLHRCFTTGLSSRVCFKHNLPITDMLYVKKHFKSLNNQCWKDTKVNREFFITDEKTFDEGLYIVNEFVHKYESIYRSSRTLDNKIYNPYYTFLQWDYYDDDFSLNKDLHSNCFETNHKVNNSDIKSSIGKDVFEYDVFIGRSIIGKDYPTAYFNYDDLLEWDITNFNSLDSSLHIHSDKEDLKKIYTDSPFATELQKTGLEPYMYLPIPLGKIVKSNFSTDSLEWSKDKIYSNGFPELTKEFNSLCKPSFIT